MKMWKTFSIVAVCSTLALSACVTDPVTGQRDRNNTVIGALGGAATCGIVGALTHGSKGARNSALACGAIGAGAGAYMDYQERQLRQSLAIPKSKWIAWVMRSVWSCLKASHLPLAAPL